MTNTKELTKVEKFEMVKEYLGSNEMLTDFINHEIELVNNRYANKKSKTSEKTLANRKANNEKLAVIIEALKEANEPMPISDLASFIPNDDGTLPTSSKVSAIMKPELRSEKNPNGHIVREIKSKTRLYHYEVKA